MALYSHRLVLRHGVFEHLSGPSTRAFSTTAARQVIRPPEPYNMILPRQAATNTRPESLLFAEKWQLSRLAFLDYLANEPKSNVDRWAEPNRWGLSSPRKADYFHNLNREKPHHQSQLDTAPGDSHAATGSKRNRSYRDLDALETEDSDRWFDPASLRIDVTPRAYSDIPRKKLSESAEQRPTDSADDDVDVDVRRPPRMVARRQTGIEPLARRAPPIHQPTAEAVVVRKSEREIPIWSSRQSRTAEDATRIRSTFARDRLRQHNADTASSSPSRPFTGSNGASRQYHSASRGSDEGHPTAVPLGQLLETISIDGSSQPRRFDGFARKDVPSPTHKLLTRSIPKARKYRDRPPEGYTPHPQHWSPRKKLTHEAMAELRSLNKADPAVNTKQALAKTYKISVESVARILKPSIWLEKVAQKSKGAGQEPDPMPARQARAGDEKERDLSATKWARPAFGAPLAATSRREISPLDD